MAFWRRVEDWVLDLRKDRPRMARYLQVAWWISNAVIVLGVVVMLLVVTGRWRP